MEQRHIIYAVFNTKSVRVYQAYSHEIADSALKNKTFFSPPFRLNRMTWIKPSFLWMMYRSFWARNLGQERILAIDIIREGFDWALQHGVLTTYHPQNFSSLEEWQLKLQNSPVRIQWDPDRDIFLKKMDRKAIQVGLKDIAVQQYVNEWIISIEDITPLVHFIRTKISNNQVDVIRAKLPMEEPYPSKSLSYSMSY